MGYQSMPITYGLLVMTDANQVGPVKGSLYVMIKLLKMTNVS